MVGHWPCLLSQYDRAGRLVYQRDERVGKGVEHVYLGDRLVAKRERNVPGDINISVTYLHTDALGSPVVATDASRTEVQRSEYEPFGLLTNRANDNRAGYTGHVMDAVTGLTYMEQRYYDPKLGLFLSADPVTAFSTPGSNFNRYWYASNNPYKFTDPDGRFVDTILDIGFIAADIVDIASNGLNAENGASLVGNVIGAAIPGATGLGKAAAFGVIAIRKADQAAGATRATHKGGDAVRTHADRVKDFKNTPGDWTRTAAQGRSTPSGSHKGGSNVESVWQNEKTGERLYSHEAYDPKTGDSIHPENRSQNLPDGGALRPDPKWEDRSNR